MKVGAKIKTAAISAAINTALGYLEKDPENNAPKLMDMIDKLVPADWYKGQRDAIREAINEKGNWFQLIQKIYALDPGVRKAFFTNFITKRQPEGQRPAGRGCREEQLQRSLGYPAGSSTSALQPALHRMLGSGVRP